MTADDLIARLFATADALDAQADAMTPSLRPTRVTRDPVTVEVDRQAQLLDLSFSSDKDRISPALLAERVLDAYREAAADSARSAGSVVGPQIRDEYLGQLPHEIQHGANTIETTGAQDPRETAGPAAPFRALRHDSEIRLPEGVDPEADPATVLAQMQATFARVASHAKQMQSVTRSLRGKGESPAGRPAVRLEINSSAALVSYALNQTSSTMTSDELRDATFDALERAREDLERQLSDVRAQLGDAPNLWPGTALNDSKLNPNSTPGRHQQ